MSRLGLGLGLAISSQALIDAANGNLPLPVPIISGSGSFTPIFTGSGSPSIPSPAISGSGSFVSSFVPSDLAGLSQWYDSDTGITNAGVNTMHWAHQTGGAGSDWTRVTTDSSPTNPSSILNVHSAVRFNGTSQSLTTADTFASVLASNGKAFTIFVVFTTPSSFGTNAANSYDNQTPYGDNAGYVWFAMKSNSGSPILRCGFWTTAENNAPDISIAASTTYIAEMKYTGAAVNSRVTSGSYGSRSIAGTPAFGNLTGVPRLGNNYSGVRSGVDVFNVVSYNTALSDSDSNQVFNYLKTRYGL